MPYHQGSSQQQTQQEQQTQEQREAQLDQLSNPIVQVDLNASPGEWEFQITGEEYVGIYHLHEDGTAMAGLGELGEDHAITPENIIVQQVEEQGYGYYDFDLGDLGEEFPSTAIATPNEFTEFITIKDYDWLVRRVENVSTFLSTFSNMMNGFNGYIAGGYLRRVIKSGDAFQFQNADLDFWFSTNDDLLGAVNFVNQGNLTQFHQPEVQEILDDKVLYSWDLISNTRDFPDIKLQFIGRLVGDISNILSYFDFTNAKIATDLNQVFIDNRWVNYENNNIVHIDIIKPSVIKRLIKYLYSEGLPFILNGSSALKFLSWVGSIVESPETDSQTLFYMQSLYDTLLNANQVDYETIIGMQSFLSELSFPSLENLSRPNLPLTVNPIPQQTQQQETQGTTY